MTGHIGTSTPKFVPPRWGRPPFDPTQTGLCKFGCVFGSGTENEHKPKLLSPDIFRWGRGLPCEGVGAKKFGMSLETREIKLFGRDIPGFCQDIPGAPEKFEKKKFGFNFWPLLELAEIVGLPTEKVGFPVPEKGCPCGKRGGEGDTRWQPRFGASFLCA